MSLQVWLPLNKNLNNYGVKHSEVTATNATLSTSIGKTGGSYSFDGSSAYLLGTQSSFSNNTEEWSFACWVRLNTTSVNQCIFSCRTIADQRGISIFYFGSQQWAFDDGVRFQFNQSTSITTNTWYHICAVRKKGVGKFFYVNGVLDGSTTETGTPAYVNTSLYSIGGSMGSATAVTGNYLNGYINDVRIYDHALSVAEVKELAKGLVCHYKLDTTGLENLLAYSKVNDANKILLKNNISSNWNNLSIVTIDGCQGYHYPSATGPTGWCSGYWYKSLEANTTYTYSAWIYFTASANFNFASLGHFQVYNSGSSASDKSHEDVVASRIYEPSTIPANKWTKVRITFTTNSLAGSYFQIYPRYNIAANTGDLYFRDCKLEKNSTPTSWVPNSADNEYKALGFDSTTVVDNSGYGYIGTKVGTITNSSDTPRYSSSIKLADSTAYVSIKPYLSNGQTLNELSVSCWFKTDTLNSTYPNIWCLGQNLFLRLRLASTTSIWYYARVGTTQKGPSVNIGKTLTDNTWHHVVLTFLNGVFVLYVDGTLINTTDYSSTATYLTCSSVGSTWLLGGYSASSEKFIGQLSDFRIFASCLSESDVKRLYNTPASVSKIGQFFGCEFNEVME